MSSCRIVFLLRSRAHRLQKSVGHPCYTNLTAQGLSVTVSGQFCHGCRETRVAALWSMEVNCKYCDQELPAESNPRRAFCNDAHKQAYWRQQHQQDQGEALLAEVEQLRTKVSDQAQEIEAQAEEIARLRTLLDIERRYLSDTKPRTFRSWLRKQPDEHQDFVRLWKLMLLERP